MRGEISIEYRYHIDIVLIFHRYCIDAPFNVDVISMICRYGFDIMSILDRCDALAIGDRCVEAEEAMAPNRERKGTP